MRHTPPNQQIIVYLLTRSREMSIPLHDVVTEYITKNDIEPEEFMRNLTVDFIERLKKSFLVDNPTLVKKTKSKVYEDIDAFFV